MAVRWLGGQRGTKRFYVESITGWPINPRSGRSASGQDASTTWFVLDRVECHREVEVFHPRAGRTPADAKVLADELAQRLNRLEERYEREQT